MKKKIILGLTSAAIGLSFLGCAGGSSNLQPKTYTIQKVEYKTYSFVKKDPIDNQKITKQQVKEFVKHHASLFGDIITNKRDVRL